MPGDGTSRQLTAAAAATAFDLEDDNYHDADVDKPIFLPAPTNITVSPGDTATLKCRVDNLGTKTVTHTSIRVIALKLISGTASNNKWSK